MNFVAVLYISVNEGLKVKLQKLTVPYISVNEGLKVVIGLSFQISARQEFRSFFY